MNGLSTTRDISEQPQCVHGPVYIISPHSSSSTRAGTFPEEAGHSRFSPPIRASYGANNAFQNFGETNLAHHVANDEASPIFVYPGR